MSSFQGFLADCSNTQTLLWLYPLSVSPPPVQALPECLAILGYNAMQHTNMLERTAVTCNDSVDSGHWCTLFWCQLPCNHHMNFPSQSGSADLQVHSSPLRHEICRSLLINQVSSQVVTANSTIRSKKVRGSTSPAALE